MTEVVKPEKLVLIFDIENLPENKITLFFKRTVTPSKIECPLYRLVHNVSGIRPEVAEYTKKLGIPYEILYRDEFIEKYDCFEVFGKFKMEDVTFPAVYIAVTHENGERGIYELVSERYFRTCELISCFGKVLERKYNQFMELGPDEYKKANERKNKEEMNEKDEKKQKVESAQKKIADMEDEIKKKQND